MPHRVERVNSLIRQEISQLLQRQVKDPRLDNFITVTEVITTPDLKHTRVFISHLGSEAEKQTTLETLTAATGFFRHELAKVLNLRYTPELSFHGDDSIERGDRISQIINQLIPEKNP
ncbi:MAG: 30S ribosome-binding factor RbfA [Dehalococcoidales bacterium]|jgi:ribosome-binding factor A|nr:30S ribosome-binding factor RbfA [Dehalococcoidales bacterium]MDP6738037.1 30S ribosome-binding factor RbfA [Dehalococcoidales bacterium]|tara:strand:- start:1975 stop:2328 length:354 start_codon:yes stop_codon:yes gene_type:complete